MIFPVDFLPILSILCLSLSLWLTICVIRQRKDSTTIIILVLNGVFLISLFSIYMYYISANDLTFIPPQIYWAFIIAGVLTGVVSFVKRFVPGQMLSAGLLLFTGYIALFSIGAILLVLFVIQFVSSIVNWKRYGLGMLHDL